jgi:hypothetical protein
LLDETELKKSSAQHDSYSKLILKSWSFWAEILLMAFTPMPFMRFLVYIDTTNWIDPSGEYPAGSHYYKTPYLFEDFAVAMMFCRLYFVMKGVIVILPPNNTLYNKRVAHESEFADSVSFQIKGAYRAAPYLITLVIAGSSILVLSYLLRIFERPYWQFCFPDDTFQNFGGF